VLGLYDKKGRLIHVGQAGTGFNQAMLKEIWQVLKELETNRNPFYGDVDAAHVHWVKPERLPRSSLPSGRTKPWKAE
jgi:bifunctional non-homologous end joining protein LigD